MTRTRRFAVAVICAAGTAVGSGGLKAQETRSDTFLTTEHWLDWERVSDAQISPDGSRIVYTRQHVNKLEDKWESNLWMLNSKAKKASDINILYLIQTTQKNQSTSQSAREIRR